MVSQYDKDDVGGVGLVKFDFLGLTTLTILGLDDPLLQAARSDVRDRPADFAARRSSRSTRSSATPIPSPSSSLNRRA